MTQVYKSFEQKTLNIYYYLYILILIQVWIILN